MPTKKKFTPGKRPFLYDQPGAPTKLSLERLETIRDAIANGASYRDAAMLADISEQTLARWRARGAAEPDSEYGEFCRAIEAARVERRRWYRAEVLKLSQEKRDFRGILAIAALTEPEEFTPKLHMIVRQELSQAIKRLSKEFENEPDLLERCLEAIVCEPVAESLVTARIHVQRYGVADPPDVDATREVIDAISAIESPNA